MSKRQATSFENKCFILQELWLNYRGGEQFAEYIEYNDLGLPLACLLHSGIVEKSSSAELFINETWGMLLSYLSIEDQDFHNLDQLLATDNEIDE